MPAFNRTIAQRNNNVTQIIPKYETILPNTDISGAALYRLTITNLQFTNGVFFVDVNGTDISGNLLNVDGLLYPLLPAEYNFPISIITFYLDIQAAASSYPGLELTIFFRNLPLARLPGPPLLTIGIMNAINNDAPPLPYILSAPYPPALGFTNISPSITLKSDGTNFNVISSGPAGWLGLPALSVILAAYENIG
jgi:hypothetical protein